MGSNYSPEGDVYSFGIVLLEMFTGKRPTYSGFNEGLNLHSYVKVALPQRIEEVLDPALIVATAESKAATKAKVDQERECLISIMRVGVACSMESRNERMDIADVVKELRLIKEIVLTLSGNPYSTSG